MQPHYEKKRFVTPLLRQWRWRGILITERSPETEPEEETGCFAKAAVPRFQREVRFVPSAVDR